MRILFCLNARFLLYHAANKRSLQKIEVNDDERSLLMALRIGYRYV